MNKDEHTLGFIVKPDGEYIEFGRRNKNAIVTSDIHYKELQNIIAEHFKEKLGKFSHITDVDSLSLLICTITNSIVFLDTTKYFGNTGCLYLPKENTKEQDDIMLNNKEYLSSFNLNDSIARFALAYDEQIKKYNMIATEQYHNINDFYVSLENKKK